MMETKICRICKQEKRLSKFPVNGNYYRNECKSCNGKHQRLLKNNNHNYEAVSIVKEKISENSFIITLPEKFLLLDGESIKKIIHTEISKFTKDCDEITISLQVKIVSNCETHEIKNVMSNQDCKLNIKKALNDKLTDTSTHNLPSMTKTAAIEPKTAVVNTTVNEPMPTMIKMAAIEPITTMAATRAISNVETGAIVYDDEDHDQIISAMKAKLGRTPVENVDYENCFHNGGPCIHWLTEVAHIKKKEMTRNLLWCYNLKKQDEVIMHDVAASAKKVKEGSKVTCNNSAVKLHSEPSRIYGVSAEDEDDFEEVVYQIKCLLYKKMTGDLAKYGRDYEIVKHGKGYKCFHWYEDISVDKLKHMAVDWCYSKIMPEEDDKIIPIEQYDEFKGFIKTAEIRGIHYWLLSKINELNENCRICRNYGDHVKVQSVHGMVCILWLSPNCAENEHLLQRLREIEGPNPLEIVDV